MVSEWAGTHVGRRRPVQAAPGIELAECCVWAYRVRRSGAVRARLPGGSTPIATGRRHRPRGGPAPAAPGGTVRGPVYPAAGPHVIDVVDAEVRMLEQVRGLGVDLERVFLIQQVQIEPLTSHLMIVLQTTTG